MLSGGKRSASPTEERGSDFFGEAVRPSPIASEASPSGGERQRTPHRGPLGPSKCYKKK